jgi:predicted dehydrogenase
VNTIATPLKVLLAGCGDMAATWLTATLQRNDLRLVGFVDLNLSAAQKRRDEFAPGAAIGTDLEATLRATAPDLVFNCTVPDAHYAVTSTAVRHGCHVLTEKPLAASMTEANAIVAEAEFAQRLVAVTQSRRYHRGIRHAATLIAQGAIGEVTEADADFFIGAHFGGFRDQMKHALLLDMAIHHFDLARLITAAEPVTVYCHEWNPRGSWYSHGANAHALFEFTRGIIFNYRGSWCAEGLRTNWNASWRIIGTEGSLSWNGEDELKLDKIVANAGFLSQLELTTSPLVPYADKENGHVSLIAEFVDCIRQGGLPETHAAANLPSLEMVLAAIESSKTGQRVTLSTSSSSHVPRSY